MTPEARVKRAVSATLRGYGDAVWFHMPVPTGRGAATLDYLGYARSIGFAVEAKRPGGRLSERQKGTVERLEAAGVKVFVIDGPPGLSELDEWLTTVINRD